MLQAPPTVEVVEKVVEKVIVEKGISEEEAQKIADKAKQEIGAVRKQAAEELSAAVKDNALAEHNKREMELKLEMEQKQQEEMVKQQRALLVKLESMEAKLLVGGEIMNKAAQQASITSTFIRAAVVYLPSTEARFLHEFRWFHRSWQAMQAFEPPGWRTDIVVVTNGLVPTLDELNCTSMPREHATDPNRCIVVATYTSLYSPAFPYAYADSVNVLAVTPLGAYDWVLRTDMDTFLTPAFATWKPSLFVVGMGGYNGMGSTNDRLDAIIVQLNLTAKTVDNVGSTWYGPTALVQQCAQLSMDVQMYMYANEFTDEEKSPEYGIKGWPNWHVGVLSMYGGHVAINHCTRDFGVVKDAHNLDFPTTSHESPTRHAHLHTWQDSNRFSKFAFADGAYKNENKSALDLDDISDYAMYMALDSQPRA
ncbi:hypothetical protein DYB30_008537 [Aphanomyces astaci]|uniref:DUF7164 domain-containing protein n=1 Tax=Aphanomyces astaci TaxID=112090 RepID=A0A397DV27_APHAT|nr:hypothetical protein DYB30_008537 [Aphanomyces astaci]